jgi:F-type H+-transporting ATPase subunit a
MQLSPDETILWQWRFVTINATLVYTWIAMAVLVLGAWSVTRRVRSGPETSTLQQLLETVVSLIDEQIYEITQRKTTNLIPFVGTLFLFIAAANLLAVIPGYRSPAGSLSTAAALATCVFIAVPVYGIAALGVERYLRQYTQPSVFMLPFNIIGELSRTLALAIRLFGNVMSGELIVAILLAVVPLFFPVVMQLFGMLVGVIQAYIFAVLATVYIASATASAEARLAKSA